MPSSSAGVRLKGRSSTNTHACGAARPRARRPARTCAARACGCPPRRRSRRRRRARRTCRAGSGARPTSSTRAPCGCPRRAHGAPPRPSPRRAARPRTGRRSGRRARPRAARRSACSKAVLGQLAGLQRDQQLARRGIARGSGRPALRVDLQRAGSRRGRRRTGSSSARRPSRSAAPSASAPLRGSARRVLGAVDGLDVRRIRRHGPPPRPGRRARARRRRTASGRGRRWCRRSRACSCPP